MWKNDYLNEIFNNSAHWYYKVQHPTTEFVSDAKVQSSPAVKNNNCITS